jgi:hypothetical protein
MRRILLLSRLLIQKAPFAERALLGDADAFPSFPGTHGTILFNDVSLPIFPGERKNVWS